MGVYYRIKGMKKILLSLGLVVATTAMCLPTETNAQLLRNHREAKAARRAAVSTRAVYAGRDVEGLTITNDPGIVTPFHSAAWALHDPYNPHPYYAYSCRGIKAGLTHGWNQEQMGIRPWHGNYNYWRWGEPTALVVPPTSSFQTSYAWGVGQTRSTPIHHHFEMKNWAENKIIVRFWIIAILSNLLALISLKIR